MGSLVEQLAKLRKVLGEPFDVTRVIEVDDGPVGAVADLDVPVPPGALRPTPERSAVEAAIVGRRNTDRTARRFGDDEDETMLTRQELRHWNDDAETWDGVPIMPPVGRVKWSEGPLDLTASGGDYLENALRGRTTIHQQNIENYGRDAADVIRSEVRRRLDAQRNKILPNDQVSGMPVRPDDPLADPTSHWDQNVIVAPGRRAAADMQHGVMWLDFPQTLDETVDRNFGISKGVTRHEVGHLNDPFSTGSSGVHTPANSFLNLETYPGHGSGERLKQAFMKALMDEGVPLQSADHSAYMAAFPEAKTYLRDLKRQAYHGATGDEVNGLPPVEPVAQLRVTDDLNADMAAQEKWFRDVMNSTEAVGNPGLNTGEYDLPQLIEYSRGLWGKVTPETQARMARLFAQLGIAPPVIAAGALGNGPERD